MLEKVCAKCGVPQPRDQFYADRSRPDGLQRTCRTCDRRRLDQADAARQTARQQASLESESSPEPAPLRRSRGRPNPNPDFGRKYRGRQPRKPPKLGPHASRREVLDHYINANVDGLAQAIVEGALAGDRTLIKLCAEHAFGKPPEHDANVPVLAQALQRLHDRRMARLAAGHAEEAAPEPEAEGADAEAALGPDLARCQSPCAATPL